MNGWIKWALFSTVLLGFSRYHTGVYFKGRGEPLLIAALFAIVGHYADRFVLPRWGNLRSATAGTLFMIVMLWMQQWLFSSARIRLSSAALIGSLFGCYEVGVHHFLLSTRPGARIKLNG
ncbi:DUF2512 family protein [Mechercharimyces sp. CAU 1602]|uniref:DUF2512 family protein n=1 Tax=Mechercharimyces sp. CAU 1602 TaxID=2973933 RepID=UPI0021630F67|nr:DUF2512 family protein [Mechercharimyces sp. CAU 1602]MCS1352169.1 DUF2512 family protein [Mechercharimyces sp. CAU 1602]